MHNFYRFLKGVQASTAQNIEWIDKKDIKIIEVISQTTIIKTNNNMSRQICAVTNTPKKYLRMLDLYSEGIMINGHRVKTFDTWMTLSYWLIRIIRLYVPLSKINANWMKKKINISKVKIMKISKNKNGLLSIYVNHQ